MFSKPQEQKVGEGAIALQVAGSAESVTINQTTHNGLTVEQVRAVATDAFRADFYQLLGQAGDIATARAQKVVEDFLGRIEKENPAALEQANTPDFRYALLTAQKVHARSGDENLETLLVELLVERSRENQRSLPQIVLNEALDTVSRLTEEQISALTIAFLLRRTINNTVFDFNGFLEMMDTRIQPLIEKSKLSNASFSHMAFTGCGVVEMGELSLVELFVHSYRGLWQLGFAANDPMAEKLPPEARHLLRQSVHTPGNFEVFDGVTQPSASMRERLLPDAEKRALIDQLLARPILPNEQIKIRCIESRPYMEALFDLWDNTSMKHFSPSSVGIAIAHANICQKIKDFGPLSIWIN
jgi:hypothetical protein